MHKGPHSVKQNKAKKSFMVIKYSYDPANVMSS